MIIDAKDAILGRLSTYAAKQVLLGNKVDIINCEEAVVSGRVQFTLKNTIAKMHRKAPTKAPYFYRSPEMFVKRTIRGMLPFKRAKGRGAFENLRCHIGVPDEFKDKKAIAFEGVNSNKLKSADYVKVKQICRAVGGKI